MKLTTTVKLTKEEIGQILTDYFVAKGMSVDNMAFNMKTVCTGYGISEMDEIVFDGISFNTELKVP